MWMSFCEERRFVRAPSLLSYEGRRRCLKLSKEGVPCPAVLLRDFNPVISRKFSRLKFLDFFHIKLLWTRNKIFEQKSRADP